AEQIVARLDLALVGAGHRSVVVAMTGSTVAGDLVATPRPRGDLEAARPENHLAHRAAIERVLAREPIDLVHMHGLDFAEYLPASPVPVLVTLHLPIHFYPSTALRPSRPRTFLQCVSEAQRRICP